MSLTGETSAVSRQARIHNPPNIFIDWEPGQGVKIDYAAIVEIMVKQLDTHPDRGYTMASCVLALLT